MRDLSKLYYCNGKKGICHRAGGLCTDDDGTECEFLDGTGGMCVEEAIAAGYPIEEVLPLVEYTYKVDVGSGCGTGSVFVREGATEDEIYLAIMNDLYDVTFERVIKEGTDDGNT